MVVRRGSQVHQVFQIGLAQIMPVSSARVTNTTPTSADAWAMASHLGVRLIRYIRLPMKTTKNARNDMMAMGTWK